MRKYFIFLAVILTGFHLSCSMVNSANSNQTNVSNESKNVIPLYDDNWSNVINDQSIKLIDSKDSKISYYGRWLSDEKGMYSGWQSSQIRFSISGTTRFCVFSYLTNKQLLGLTSISVDIDGGDYVEYHFFHDPSNSNISGIEAFREITIPILDTGIHYINMKLSTYGDRIFDGSSIIELVKIGINKDGTLSPDIQTGKKIMFIGDSWMSAFNDWPRFLSSKYYVYPVAIGGATAAFITNKIEYQKSGIYATDPALDGIIISFGVNDFLYSSTHSPDYESSIISIINSIRKTQPTAPIFLVQTPRDLIHDIHYDMYEPQLKDIESKMVNVNYITSEPIWNTLTWMPEGYHLDLSGRKLFASYVETELNKYY